MTATPNAEPSFAEEYCVRGGGGGGGGRRREGGGGEERGGRRGEGEIRGGKIRKQ